MNRNYVTNITHFLDENGTFPLELTKEARLIAESLGKVITCVTKESRNTSKTDVVCWSTFNKKKCAGVIDAGIDLDSFTILWNCNKCGDSGTISNWENTVMDSGYRP